MIWFRNGWGILILFAVGLLQFSNCNDTTCTDSMTPNCPSPLTCSTAPVTSSPVTSSPCNTCHIFPAQGFGEPLVCQNCMPEQQQQPPQQQQTCNTCYLPTCANCATPQTCHDCTLNCNKCDDNNNGCHGNCNVTTCHNCLPNTTPGHPIHCPASCPGTIQCPDTCLTCPPPPCGNCTNGNVYYWTEMLGGDPATCPVCVPGDGSGGGGGGRPPWLVDRDDRIFFDYEHGQVAVSSTSSAKVKYPKVAGDGKPQAFISSVSGAQTDPDAAVTVVDGGAGSTTSPTDHSVTSNYTLSPETRSDPPLPTIPSTPTERGNSPPPVQVPQPPVLDPPATESAQLRPNHDLGQFAEEIKAATPIAAEIDPKEIDSVTLQLPANPPEGEAGQPTLTIPWQALMGSGGGGGGGYNLGYGGGGGGGGGGGTFMPIVLNTNGSDGATIAAPEGGGITLPQVTVPLSVPPYPYPWCAPFCAHPGLAVPPMCAPYCHPYPPMCPGMCGPCNAFPGVLVPQPPLSAMVHVPISIPMPPRPSGCPWGCPYPCAGPPPEGAGGEPGAESGGATSSAGAGPITVDTSKPLYHWPWGPPHPKPPPVPQPPGVAADSVGEHNGQPKHTWGYRETADAYGPDNWAKIAPKCAGTNQSPINIVTTNALERDIENPIAISMDDPSGAAIIKGRLVNNGKTIGFEVGPNSPPVKLTADIFEGKTYVLKQFHLHFGCEGEKGSEHSIDGEKFSGEMHLVFKNEAYANPKKAMQQKDGLAILAFFLQVRPDADANPAFDKIASNIKNIQFTKQQLVVPGGLSIVNLIPPLQDGLVNLKRYMYKGSLPTPPCYESVTWIVFKRAISIQPQRVPTKAFGDGSRLMCDNFRPVQELNGRDVYKHTAPGAAAVGAEAAVVPQKKPGEEVAALAAQQPPPPGGAAPEPAPEVPQPPVETPVEPPTEAAPPAVEAAAPVEAAEAAPVDPPAETAPVDPPAAPEDAGSGEEAPSKKKQIHEAYSLLV